MCLVCDLGEQQEVIRPIAVGVLPLFSIAVAPLKRDAVGLPTIGLVLPDTGLD